MNTEVSIYEYAKHGLALSADKPAIWYYGKSMTYQELFRCIDNVADHLYALGVREGSVVTIHLPNCPQAVMAVYAVAKLGGICNIVHAQMPLQALLDTMDFTKSSLLISYRPFELTGIRKILYVDLAYHMGVCFQICYHLKTREKCPYNTKKFEELEEQALKQADIPEQERLARKCAVFLHSSGTTGDPKIVMHNHAALNKWVDNAQHFLNRDSLCGEKLLEVLPMFHGSGLVMDMHQLISGGGQLVQMSAWNIDLAAHLIKKKRITILTGVPKVYQDLLKSKRASMESIRECYVSGDYVGIQLKKDFNSLCGERNILYEGYGMTETVTACFSCGKDHGNLLASGYPLPNCEMAVIDSTGNPQHYGDGEFIVSTNTMMMGYLNNEEATEAALIDWNQKRWFRTGDIGSIGKDGYIYFKERKKNTIIHNGYNVYPAEIEQIIQGLEEIEDTCVVGVSDTENKTQQIRVCAVLKPGIDSKHAEKKIFEICRQRLPRYALPKQIFFLNCLPRNEMAKIDRQALEKM